MESFRNHNIRIIHHHNIIRIMARIIPNNSIENDIADYSDDNRDILIRFID